jgi:hypothetical protein
MPWDYSARGYLAQNGALRLGRQTAGTSNIPARPCSRGGCRSWLQLSKNQTPAGGLQRTRNDNPDRFADKRAGVIDYDHRAIG